MVAHCLCCLNARVHSAKPREIQGQDRRKDSKEPRQTVKNQQRWEIRNYRKSCSSSHSLQHIGIQAEICGMKVKLGGQLQSFLICSSWLLSPLSILHTSSGLAAYFTSKISSASSSHYSGNTHVYLYSVYRRRRGNICIYLLL